MLKRLIFILIIAVPCWYYSDMDNPSRFYAYVLPIATFLASLAFCLWIIEVFEHIGDKSNRHSS